VIVAAAEEKVDRTPMEGSGKGAMDAGRGLREKAPAVLSFRVSGCGE